MEIKKTSSYLTINNKHFNRNFSFKMVRSSNSLQKIASVRVKRDYFLANRVDVQVGDNLYLSIQNNLETKTWIFSGVVKSVSSTSQEIHIEAVYKCVDDSIFEETYKDTALKDVLGKLCSKLDYQASTTNREQVIVQGTKELSMYRLLENHYYYLDTKDNLVVLDAPKEGKNYVVDDNLYSAKAGCITIFPIPELEINDTVEYLGIKYIVRDIIYNYLSKAQMVLGVE